MKFPPLVEDYGVTCDQGTGDRVVVVTVHETQSTTLAPALSALKNRTDGSAHELIGWDGNKLKGYRLAKPHEILCGVGGQNGLDGKVNYHIEKVGLSVWKKAFRLASSKERTLIKWTAYRTARRLHKEDLPSRYLTIQRLERGDHFSDARGFTYHRNLSLAFHTSTHTDPGIPGVTWPHGYMHTFEQFYYRFPDVHETVSLRHAKRALRAGHV